MTEIISRKSWGARYEAGFRAAPLPAERLYLHHSVTVAPDLVPPFLDDDAAIRTLERIGQNRFGGGISYTFAITPVGRIYEGHGVGRQGAHTAGLNSTARAICWVGNYDVAHPPQPMVDATVWLVRHGHAQGWWRQPRFTGGHKDAPGASTACPGRHAYALIGEMNLLAAAPATPAPTPAPPPRPSEDDMTPDQDRMLRVVYDQLTGNNFVGWPTWQGGTEEAMTLVDYARRANVEVRQVHRNLTDVHTKLDALSVAAAADSGAPATVNTTALVQELAAELVRQLFTARPKETTDG